MTANKKCTLFADELQEQIAKAVAETELSATQESNQSLNDLVAKPANGIMGDNILSGTFAKAALEKTLGSRDYEFQGFYRNGQSTGRPSQFTYAGEAVRQKEAAFKIELEKVRNQVRFMVKKQNVIDEVLRMNSEGLRNDQIVKKLLEEKKIKMSVRNVQIILKTNKTQKLKTKV